MLGARMTSIFRAGEKAVVAARRGVRMIVSVTLSLIITPALITFVIIPMIVCTHGLMLIRATLVGSILRADHRRGQCRHGESR
jgi:hypothetical protein